MKRFAICTITSGDFFEQLAETSHPTFKAYAEKCNANFIVSKDITTKIVGYSKLKLIRDLLEKYERVCFIDTDILIRFDAPNLFDLVPEDRFGVFNEWPMFPNERNRSKRNFLQQIAAPINEWVDTDKYYNTGVMVVSKKHKKIFCEAAVEIDNFAEQTLINYRLFDQNIDVFHLPHRFNRIIPTLRISGEQLDDSYFLHFAGAFLGETKDQNYQAWVGAAKRFAHYRKTQNVPELPKRIYIETAGALGDVVSTEPVVRYIREVIEPKAEIVIKTLFPPVFEHMKDHLRTKILGPKESTPDKGHLKLFLFPDPPLANYNLMPAIDYAALCTFRGQVPKDHRHIKLKVTAKSPVDTSEMVLIHPGRSWQSKTFPKQWWQAVIDGLKDQLPVAIIGKTYPDDDFRGTVDIDASDCIDLRNKTSLPELIAAISTARLLVSNDSSPVHIAGAFKTPVIMISTAKQPEFVWPYRDDSLNIAMGRTIKEGAAQIGVVNNIYMDKCKPEELLAVLPNPSDVVEKALQSYEKYHLPNIVNQ